MLVSTIELNTLAKLFNDQPFSVIEDAEDLSLFEEQLSGK